MPRFTTFFLAVSVCLPAYAEECRPTPPITLHRDEPLDTTIFFDNKPAPAVPLQLYAGNSMVRSAVADRNGRVLWGLLPVGNYRIVIPGRATLNLVILPQRSGLNGDMIDWFLFPKSTSKWVQGRQVPGKPCPLIALKAD